MVTVVDENEVEESDKEKEQEEQTEPVNVVEQTDEKDTERESEMSEEEGIKISAITEYLSLTGQAKLQNRKIISERKQTFYRNSSPVRRIDKNEKKNQFCRPIRQKIA
jgi:hypothetical protein